MIDIQDIVLIAVVVIALVVMTQIKVPLCYQQPGKEPPATFITYDEGIVDQIKSSIREEPFYFLKINGRSMEPGINSGQKCLCVKQDNYKVGDIVAYYIRKGSNKVELISHRIVGKDGLYRDKR